MDQFQRTTVAEVLDLELACIYMFQCKLFLRFPKEVSKCSLTKLPLIKIVGIELFKFVHLGFCVIPAVLRKLSIQLSVAYQDNNS